MNIAKGIAGIRAIKAANRAGWHVCLGDNFTTYSHLTFAETVELNSWRGWTLVEVVGNGLHFQKIK